MSISVVFLSADGQIVKKVNVNENETTLAVHSDGEIWYTVELFCSLITGMNRRGTSGKITSFDGVSDMRRVTRIERLDALAIEKLYLQDLTALEPLEQWHDVESLSKRLVSLSICTTALPIGLQHLDQDLPHQWAELASRVKEHFRLGAHNPQSNASLKKKFTKIEAMRLKDAGAVALSYIGDDDDKFAKTLAKEPMLWHWRNAEHETLLHVAARRGALNIARWLLDAAHNDSSLINSVSFHLVVVATRDDLCGCQVNMDGATPLHEACAKGHVELVRLLVEPSRHANLDAKIRSSNKTPLDIASEKQFTTIVDLLSYQTQMENLAKSETHLHELRHEIGERSAVLADLNVKIAQLTAERDDELKEMAQLEIDLSAETKNHDALLLRRRALDEQRGGGGGDRISRPSTNDSDDFRPSHDDSASYEK
jgi:ankyrin repeat protein